MPECHSCGWPRLEGDTGYPLGSYIILNRDVCGSCKEGCGTGAEQPGPADDYENVDLAGTCLTKAKQTPVTVDMGFGDRCYVSASEALRDYERYHSLLNDGGAPGEMPEWRTEAIWRYVTARFSMKQDPRGTQALMETRDRFLLNISPNFYWGTAKGAGHNALGLILMMHREKLLAEEALKTSVATGPCGLFADYYLESRPSWLEPLRKGAGGTKLHGLYSYVLLKGLRESQGKVWIRGIARHGGSTEKGARSPVLPAPAIPPARPLLMEGPAHPVPGSGRPAPSPPRELPTRRASPPAGAWVPEPQPKAGGRAIAGSPGVRGASPLRSNMGAGAVQNIAEGALMARGMGRRQISSIVAAAWAERGGGPRRTASPQ